MPAPILFSTLVFAVSAFAAPDHRPFAFDRETARCLNAAGEEGLNPGRLGECGELSQGSFDAPGDSLSGSVWRGLDLSGRDLSGARLEGVRISSSDLSGARLNRAVAPRLVFEGGSLAGARLRNADLGGARIAASLEDADLSDADLRGADLSGSSLRGAKARRARYDEKTKLPISIGKAYRLGMVFSGTKTPAVDEGETDPSFRAFRAALKTALEKKDATVVIPRLTKVLRARCGAAEAFTCFEPLAEAMAGGGVFTDDSYSGFLAPASALVEHGVRDVFFSKSGNTWEIVEIGRPD